MNITADTLVPELLQERPACRAVLDRYELAGCGGFQGPYESVGFFARAHQVDLSRLLAELRNASALDSSSAAYVESRADTIYRGFFRAGIVSMFTAGGVFGAVLLGILAWQGDWTSLDLRAAIWAHAHAQIAGWVTFFVMGFGYQAFPRFKHVKLAWPGLASATLPIMVVGLALRVGAGFFDQTTVGQVIGAAGGAAELFAVCCFIAILAKTWSRTPQPRQPWESYVFAALGWMLLAFVVDIAIFAASALPGTEREWIDFIALYDAPWRDIQLLGFAGGMILGVSQRFLPFIYGFREPSRPVALGAFWLWNGAVAAEIVLYMAFAQTRRMDFGLAWLAAVAAMPAAVLLLLRSMGVFSRNEEADRSLPFIQASFAWSFVSFSMLLLTPLHSAAVGQAFSHAWFGAFRHALTVGFISLMIVGVSSKVVPVLAGVDPARLSSLRAAFWLLNIGCSMRVGFQVATDLCGWAFPPTALSAPVELAGFGVWALDLLRTMRPAKAAPESPKNISAITAQSRVADVLAVDARIEPVFLRFGFNRILDPVARRTLGRTVTIAQACRLKGVDPDTFVASLGAAVKEHPEAAAQQPVTIEEKRDV
jgi:hypothetical protein